MSARRRSRRCRRGSTPARTIALGTSYGVFGNFPVPIAGKTGTAQKDITLPGLSDTRSSSTSRGGAATARSTRPTIVVCAVIENGGHGGTAAAPAALKVFEQYFHKHRHRDPAHLRLMR